MIGWPAACTRAAAHMISAAFRRLTVCLCSHRGAPVRCGRPITKQHLTDFKCAMTLRHDGEQPAALQPSAPSPACPNSEPDRFSRALQEHGMENYSGSLQREGVFIDPDFCDERCALRNLFGLAISPQTPLSPLVEAIGARLA